MRKILLGFVTVLWILAGVQLTKEFHQEDENKLVEAFSKTNYTEAESKIEVCGDFHQEYLTSDEQEQFLVEVAKEIGITQNYDLTTACEDNRKEVVLYKNAKQAVSMMKIVTVEHEIEENVMDTEQYFILELTLQNSVEPAMLYKKRIENIMEKYPVLCTYTIDFDGSFYGILTLEEKNKITNQLLHSLFASVIEEKRTQELYSVYAYTKLVEDYRLVNSEKVNVNIVVNDDEDKNMTHIHVVTPIMNGDY